MTITGAAGDAVARQWDERNKQVQSLIDCICKINNTQVDNAKDLDIVMLIYNMTNYGKTLRSLWQYHKAFPNDKNIFRQ